MNARPERIDLSNRAYEAEYAARKPQHTDLLHLAQILIRLGGGYNSFSQRVSVLMRKAFDEVIDMPRTGRWSVEQLEKTEKTYIGTKVEILLRNEFSLPKGKKLDFLIDGIEVDVKNTIGGNWTIPQEAFGEVCMLISGKDATSTLSVGLFRALPEYLNAAENRDRKKTIRSDVGLRSICWIMRDAPLHRNFLLGLQEGVRQRILAQSSGNGRIRELFRNVLGVPIHRGVIEGLAQQKDALKRVRANGGARDQLLKEGIVILSGKYDEHLIKKKGLPHLSSEEFISIRVENLDPTVKTS